MHSFPKDAYMDSPTSLASTQHVDLQGKAALWVDGLRRPAEVGATTLSWLLDGRRGLWGVDPSQRASCWSFAPEAGVPCLQGA